MTSESSSNQKKSGDNSMARQFADQVKRWLEDNNLEMSTKVEAALETAADLADQGLVSAKSTVDTIREFKDSLQGIESFKVIPKSSSMAVEVEIKCKDEQDLEVKQPIAPFVELYALHFGKHISFEAQVNKAERGVQLEIHKGFALKIIAPLIGIQTLEVSGKALLKHDTKGQIILVLTRKVPGTDTPVTIEIPIRTVVDGVQQFKKMTS